MRTKDDFIYYRDCLFCGEKFVSNRSNKTPLKFKRIGIEGARPDTLCCNGRCAALRKSHGTFERYVLAEQMEDASAMMAEQSLNRWKRMISDRCVLRVRQQVREMLKRLHKKCKACDQVALLRQWFCSECKQKRDRDTCTKGNHRRRCRKFGGQYSCGVTIAAIVKRDGDSCHYCNMKTKRWNGIWMPQIATIDHVIPLSKGGDHSMENCVIACGACNSKKSNKIRALC